MKAVFSAWLLWNMLMQVSDKQTHFSNYLWQKYFPRNVSVLSSLRLVQRIYRSQCGGNFFSEFSILLTGKLFCSYCFIFVQYFVQVIISPELETRNINWQLARSCGLSSVHHFISFLIIPALLLQFHHWIKLLNWIKFLKYSIKAW